MSEERPRLDRVETIGDDRPAWTDRIGQLRRSHPALAALLALAVVVVASGVAVGAWRMLSAEEPPPRPTRPDGPLVRVASTGQGGVVVERLSEPDGTTVIVMIEVKVGLIGPKGLVGQVRGFSGPGVQSSRAPGIPPVLSGGSSVGLVKSTVRCSEVGVGSDSPRLVDTVAPLASAVPPPLEGALGSVEPEWTALLARACAP